MTRSRFCASLLPAVLLGILVACNDSGVEEGTVGDRGEVEQGGTAIVAEVADISTPSPLLAMTAIDGALSSDVLNMQLLDGRWEDGRLVFSTAEESAVALARRYEFVGDDSSSVRFHMRSDVLWSDGEPLTAHDVVFTYELAGHPALPARAEYVESLDSVVAENDSVVTFHFANRYADMMVHTTLAPVPRHVYETVSPEDYASHPSITSPAGQLVVSGPFMISQHLPGQQVVLTRNPHFQPRANLDQIVFRIIPEATTRMVEIQTGAVDFVPNISFDQIARLREAAPHVRFETEEKRVYDYVAYNPAGFEAFADPEIRRALGLAIDAETLIDALELGEFAVPAGGPYPPIFTDLYDEEGAAPLPYDPERASEILAARGWEDSDGDGILDREGRPFRFTMITNTGNQRRSDAMQIIQQQWRRIGVDVQLRAIEFNTFMQAITGRDYEAALGGWVVSLSPGLSIMWAPDSPYNITGYDDPQVSALFEQAIQQPTPEAAAPLWREAASRIARDQPYTWLYYFDNVVGVNQRLRGVHVDTYGAYQNTWEWWIPAEYQRGRTPVQAQDSSAAN